jgi:hypothetical protein
MGTGSGWQRAEGSRQLAGTGEPESRRLGETGDKRQADEERRTGCCRSEPSRHRETAAEPGAIPPSREATAQRKMGIRGQGGREMVWGPIPSRLHPPSGNRGV